MKFSFRLKAFHASRAAPWKALFALGASLLACSAHANIDLSKLQLPSFLGGGQARQALDPGMLAGLALSKVLDNELPVRLDAKQVYPSVPAPPGGPFAITARLAISPESLSQPLAAGDYEIPVYAYAMDSSLPRPGGGVAYQLGALQGRAAEAISTLFWRAQLANVNPTLIAITAVSIQSGVTYAHLPLGCQKTVDQLIPDMRDQLKGDYIETLQLTYAKLGRFYPLPALPDLLMQMGPNGKTALIAISQQQTLQRQQLDDDKRAQILVAGQESGVYAPVQAEVGPWTERMPGIAYMRLKIVAGPMGVNTLQVRVLASPAGSPATAPTLMSLFGAKATPQGAARVTGLVGYSMFQPAQPLSIYPLIAQR